MIVLSLFGTTTGLEVQHFMPGKDASPIKIDNTWVEVSPNQVALRSDADCYLVQRRKQDGKTLTWVGLYRSAREIGYDRQGGFYGAGVWLIDITVDAHTLLEVLVNLANQVRDKALSGGKFIKRIADIRSEISMPPQLGALASTLGSLTGGGCSDSGSLAFVVGIEPASATIDWAQKSRTAELFSTVFVGSVDQYVSNKTEFQQIYKFNGLQDAIDAAYVKRVNDLTNHNQKLTKDFETGKDNLTQALLTEKDAKASFQQLEQQLLLAQRQIAELKNSKVATLQPQPIGTSDQGGGASPGGSGASDGTRKANTSLPAQTASTATTKDILSGMAQTKSAQPKQPRSAPKSIFDSIGKFPFFLVGLILGMIVCAGIWKFFLSADSVRKDKSVSKNALTETQVPAKPIVSSENIPAPVVCEISKNRISATISIKDKSNKLTPEDIVDKIKGACPILGPECSQELFIIKEKIGETPLKSKDIDLPETCLTDLPIEGKGFSIVKKEVEKDTAKKTDPKPKGAK